MKNTRISHIFAIISILFLSSCENEPIDPAIDLTPDIPTVPTASFTVNFDGLTYIATQADANIGGGQISINAIKGVQEETFSFAIGGTTVGSYLANENIISYRAGNTQPWYISIQPGNEGANTGQVTITSIDNTNKTITGTFTFKGYYDDGTTVVSKEFTNGVFTNLPYTTN